MVRLISGNVDLSNNPRGWLAPTNRQPVFASFYNAGFAGNNLVPGGAQAQIVGAPTLTTGIAGTEQDADVIGLIHREHYYIQKEASADGLRRTECLRLSRHGGKLPRT